MYSWVGRGLLAMFPGSFALSDAAAPEPALVPCPPALGHVTLTVGIFSLGTHAF